MKNFWVSFWVSETHSAFELHSPWWISGYRFVQGTTLADLEDGEKETPTESSVCAAVKAPSEEAAREIIYACFDRRPAEIEFRFINERPDDWTPFGDRFNKADWMKW